MLGDSADAGADMLVESSDVWADMLCKCSDVWTENARWCMMRMYELKLLKADINSK